MATALINAILNEGDLIYMGKLKVSHISGNFNLLGIEVTPETEVVYSKKSERTGKRINHEYRISFNNLVTGEHFGVTMLQKPGKEVIHGSLSASTWDRARILRKQEYCTVQFSKDGIEVVFFKTEVFYKNGKSVKIPVNAKGELLKDDVMLFDAIKYLRLDASPVTLSLNE